MSAKKTKRKTERKPTKEQFLAVVEDYYKDWSDTLFNLRYTTLNLAMHMLGMFPKGRCRLTTVSWGEHDVSYVRLTNFANDPQVVFGSDYDDVERDLFDLPLETMSEVVGELHDIITHRTA